MYQAPERDAAAPRQAQRLEVGDVRDGADEAALVTVDRPCPARRLVTAGSGPAAAAVAHPRRHRVEHDPAGRDARRTRREQVVHLVPGEVHEQALRRDQHRVGRVDLAEPALVERRARDQAHARIAGEQLAAKRDRLRQVDADPPRPALVDAPELRLEPLAERHHRPVRVAAQEPAHLAVEAGRPQRLPLGQRRRRGAEARLEGEVDRVDELDRPRVGQHGVGPAGLGGAVVEVPEQRLGDCVECDRHARPLPVPAAS